MTNRILRRRVIIREYDFEKVRAQAIGEVGFMRWGALYDRAEFTPLTLEGLEKENVVDLLKGKERKFRALDQPNLMLYYLKDYLYNEKYFDWDIKYDENKQLWIQARKNTPRTRLGWGIFEKDLSCKI